MSESVWPSLRDVRADLIRLRVGYGIRYEVMTKALHLRGLRVVKNEASRQQRDLETDGAYIAYEVVRCAAHSDELGDRIRRLLVVALNFEQSETSLEQRRRLLQEELRVAEDAYEDLEERAFQQLAGMLIDLDSSPCGEAGKLLQRDSCFATG